MRENRPYGSEGGESGSTGLPYPYLWDAQEDGTTECAYYFGMPRRTAQRSVPITLGCPGGRHNGVCKLLWDAQEDGTTECAYYFGMPKTTAQRSVPITLGCPGGRHNGVCLLLWDAQEDGTTECAYYFGMQ
jgi:hypothetical protein